MERAIKRRREIRDGTDYESYLIAASADVYELAEKHTINGIDSGVLEDVAQDAVEESNLLDDHRNCAAIIAHSPREPGSYSSHAFREYDYPEMAAAAYQIVIPDLVSRAENHLEVRAE